MNVFHLLLTANVTVWWIKCLIVVVFSSSYQTLSQLCRDVFVDAPVSAAECQREVGVLSEHDINHNHELLSASDQL